MIYKILVADDSPSTQKLIQMSFPTSEFEIVIFSDGQEVLDSLSRISPDAILLNLSLPQKDGYEHSAGSDRHGKKQRPGSEKRKTPSHLFGNKIVRPNE